MLEKINSTPNCTFTPCVLYSGRRWWLTWRIGRKELFLTDLWTKDDSQRQRDGLRQIFLHDLRRRRVSERVQLIILASCFCFDFRPLQRERDALDVDKLLQAFAVVQQDNRRSRRARRRRRMRSRVTQHRHGRGAERVGAKRQSRCARVSDQLVAEAAP